MIDTTKVRLVLADCEIALEELIETKSDETRFRLRWISALALLQTCKDVVFNVMLAGDRKSSAYVVAKRIFDEEIRNGAPSIYLEFVNKERNKICHEYKLGFVFDKRKFWSLGGGRAIQFWLHGAEREQLIEADGVGIECEADVLDAVGAQDVEGD